MSINGMVQILARFFKGVYRFDIFNYIHTLVWRFGNFISAVRVKRTYLKHMKKVRFRGCTSPVFNILSNLSIRGHMGDYKGSTTPMDHGEVCNRLAEKSKEFDDEYRRLAALGNSDDKIYSIISGIFHHKAIPLTMPMPPVYYLDVDNDKGEVLLHD